MPLAAAALQPLIVPQLIGVGTGGDKMTLADLVTTKSAGYDLSAAPKKGVKLDFRETLKQ